MTLKEFEALTAYSSHYTHDLEVVVAHIVGGDYKTIRGIETWEKVYNRYPMLWTMPKQDFRDLRDAGLAMLTEPRLTEPRL